MWNIKILFVAFFVVICFGQDYTHKSSLTPTSNQALPDWEFQKLLHEAEYDDALQVEEEGLLHVNKVKQKSPKKELYLKKPLKKQQKPKLRKVKTISVARNFLRYKELSKKNQKKITEFMKNIDPNKIQSDTKNIVDNRGKHFVYDKKTILTDAESQDTYWKNAETKKSEPRKNVSNNYKLREIENMKNHHRPKRAVTAKRERLWDYGVIPYEIDKIFSGFHKALFKQAMRHWENFTCIKFVERDPKIHKNFIYFTVRNCGCCSFVGKRGNGRQAISIGRNCEKFGIVVHELGHVIGFWHEHTRIDRDKHIQINRANILKGQEYNFNVLSPEDVDSLGLPYDYNSIMHYAKNTFSKSVYLDTILPIRGEGENKPEIGQRIHLSNGDIGQANLLYQCPKCGRTYQQNTGEISSPHFYSKQSENTQEKCEWRITATHGERIILKILKLNIIENPNCQDNYLEIRDGYWFKSPLIKRLCGNITSQLVTTISSRMLVTYVNTNLHLGYNGFKAEFEVACGGDLFITEDHRIDSPNYPLEYLPEKECIWKITVPEDHQVALKFNIFEIENHDSCIYDYVEIRDGDSPTSELIGIFCGYKLPPNIKSNSNKMFVKFVSDSSVQKVGFSATFMKEVDECKTGDHGCDHECINTLGSYECDCHAGYELQNDGRTCEDYTHKYSLTPTSNQALPDWEFQKLLHEAEYDDALQVEEEGLLHVNKVKQKSPKKELYLKKPLKKQQKPKLRKVKTISVARNFLRYKELSKKNQKKITEFMKNIDPNKIQSDTKNIVDNRGKHFVYDKKTILTDAESQDTYWKNAETKKSEPRKNVSNNYKLREIENMKNHHRPKRAVTAKRERLWDYGVIPYEIDKIFSGFHKALFKQAMRHWENFTCIKFVERDPKIHKNFIYFTVRNCGCCSFVGKRGNGRQAISIGRNCEKFGIVVHELGHVIGFWHEHTRIDRDKHIQINRANILKGQEYNFNVLSPEDVDSLGLPYDYNSIMHYAKNTFSKSVYLDTILPIRGEGENKPEIGQRIHLSNGDIGQANLLYQCPQCGRTYQQNTGEISSPHFYSKQSENTQEKCEWRITATHGERIILKILKLNIIENPNCQDNYLEIRDGYWFKSPLIKRLCGNITSQLVTTISSRMLVTYVNTNLHLGYNGFKAEFEVACGGDLFITEDHRIDSPNYPLEYLPEKECIWKITVPEDHQVALKFNIFEIENHDSCIYDYVEIRDGDSPTSELIGIFCGYKLPPNIKSNSNKMFVKFVSDSSVQKVGFSATFMKEVDECKTGDHGCDHECINTLGSYECDCHAGYELQNDGRTCEDACGGVFQTTNGTFTSPSYPDVYPILKQCIWEIIAPEKHSVFLNFTHFDLEGTKYHYMECNYDYLTIYSKLKDNRLRKVGVFCGNELPPIVKSEQNILRIEFYSDKSIQHTGFIGNFFTDYDECATNNGGCMHNCRNTYGSYECSCRNGYALHENGHNCSETNCKFEITNPYGLIYSPNYPHEYPRNTYCFWHFSTVPGHRVQLTFNEFDVEDHQECIYDYVAIYDGNSENSSTLGVYCGGRQPYTVVASTNEMFMVLKTDIGLQKKGFIATHSTECGGYLRATNQTRHFLSHPKYGYKNYKRDMYCTWRIQADVHNSVKLIFSTFEVEYSEKCNYDFVEITEEASLIRRPHHGKFCGNRKPPEIISLSDTLLVRFQTDESTSLKGFSASYVAVDPPEVDEVLDYEDTLATPFPGYMKSVYLTDSMYYDEYEDFSRIPIRMNKARKNLQ